MKIKSLTKEQIIISLDRLTRFKNTETKYLRVFKDIILHNLLSPNFNKYDLEKMPYNDLKMYAQEVFNFSVKNIFGGNSSDFSLNQKLKKYEESIFLLDEDVKKLLDNEFDFVTCLGLINENSVKNLKWLKCLAECDDTRIVREKFSLGFPVEIVVIVEGATEETLLPVFADLYGFNFEKNGVYLIPAGGKNQVVKLYYELCETLKLPVFVLLDQDGVQNAQEIYPKLRSNDKIHIINCGEFEDILSKDLVERTLNYELQNISETKIDFQEEKGHRVEYLEEVFKHRGRHEFKKVEFSQMVRANIKSDYDLTPEIIEIIEEIKKLKSNC